MTDEPISEREQLELMAAEQGKVLANGHVYKLYFGVDAKRPDDKALASALASLGAVKIQHVSEGGKNAIITPTINTKEHA